jgi:pyruvate,water dikinase
VLRPLLQCATAADCGAKAANLARIAALGFDVPAGVAIPGSEYRQHLRRAGISEVCERLEKSCAGLDAAALASNATAISDAICGTALAPALQEALDAALAAIDWRWPVAVRSSADAEDSAHASFAGQLDSVLHVDTPKALADAIRTVWASAWSARCLRYAQQRGTGPGAVGVVLQRQVDARYSGVMFTRDPLGRDDAAVIEFVGGLGEALVSGRLTPGSAKVIYPALQVAHNFQGSDDNATRPPDAVLRQLTLAGLDLERGLGGAQDVEWSLDVTGRLWLLQARPAKIAKSRPQITWSNANIARNFPDAVTPFLASIVTRGYTAYFRNLGLGFGISPQRIAAMAPELERLVGLQGGRLYYNLSAIHAVLCLAPDGRRLAEWFNQFTGAQAFPSVHRVDLGSLGRAIEWVRVACHAAGQYLFIERRVATFESRVDRYAEGTHPARIHLRSRETLRGDLAAFLDIRLNRWNDAALADAAAMVCYGLLRKKLSTLEMSDCAALQNDLLKGMPDLASARPVSALWALACDLRANAHLSERFLSPAADDPIALLSQPEHAAFRLKFERYLDKWGFRYSRELMLTSPTPQEDPLPMIRILQSYLRDTGPGPDVVVAGQAASRLAATIRLESRLSPVAWVRSLPLSTAGRFRLLLRMTQNAIRLRERARMKQALLYTRLRHVALAIGTALVAQQVLVRREDVFFLSVDEVLDLLGETSDTSSVAERVASRRAAFDACERLQPPDVLHMPEGVSWVPGNATIVSAGSSGESNTLRGVSACGGTFEGPAVVVETVAEIDRIKRGDVLVTRQTDPGWAAVFFLVKGLVIERGGMLSHGAIIAREYGIPAVVGVPNATRRIRDGERIRVNGDLGIVDIGL